MCESPATNAKILRQVQAVDRNAVEVIEKSCFTELYEYSVDDDQWVECGVSGGFYIYRSNTSPCYNLLIVNKQNPKEFLVPVTGATDVFMNGNFVMLKNEKIIQCLWFNDQSEGSRITQLIKTLIIEEGGYASSGGSENGSMSEMENEKKQTSLTQKKKCIRKRKKTDDHLSNEHEDSESDVEDDAKVGKEKLPKKQKKMNKQKNRNNKVMTRKMEETLKLEQIEDAFMRLRDHNKNQPKPQRKFQQLQQ